MLCFYGGMVVCDEHHPEAVLQGMSSSEVIVDQIKDRWSMRGGPRGADWRRHSLALDLRHSSFVPPGRRRVSLPKDRVGAVGCRRDIATLETGWAATWLGPAR